MSQRIPSLTFQGLRRLVVSKNKVGQSIFKCRHCKSFTFLRYSHLYTHISNWHPQIAFKYPDSYSKFLRKYTRDVESYMKRTGQWTGHEQMEVITVDSDDESNKKDAASVFVGATSSCGYRPSVSLIDGPETTDELEKERSRISVIKQPISTTKPASTDRSAGSAKSSPYVETAYGNGNVKRKRTLRHSTPLPSEKRDVSLKKADKTMDNKKINPTEEGELLAKLKRFDSSLVEKQRLNRKVRAVNRRLAQEERLVEEGRDGGALVQEERWAEERKDGGASNRPSCLPIPIDVVSPVDINQRLVSSENHQLRNPLFEFDLDEDDLLDIDINEPIPDIDLTVFTNFDDEAFDIENIERQGEVDGSTMKMQGDYPVDLDKSIYPPATLDT